MCRLSTIWFCSLLFGVLSIGCGERAAETAAERAMERASGDEAEVDIDSEGGGMRVKSGEGELNVGANAEVPDDFPDDVPLYPDIEVYSSAAQRDQGAFSVQGRTPDSIEDVVAFYKKEAADSGWTESMSMKQPQAHMLGFEKDDRTINLMITPENGQTSVLVTASKKQ